MTRVTGSSRISAAGDAPRPPARSRAALPRLGGLRRALDRVRVNAASWLAPLLTDPDDGTTGERPAPSVLLRIQDRALSVARDHPRATDLAIAAALAAVSALRLARNGGLDATTVLLQIALTAPLIARRRHPVAVFAAVCVAAAVQWLLAGPLLADLSLLLALLPIALHGRRRIVVAATAVLEIGVVMASVRWSLAGSWLHSVVFLSAMVAATVLLGANVRARRAQLSAASEQAERRERDRTQQARLAAVAERTRIARDMHDVLAHSLAVIISLADGAGAKLTRQPDRAATAIGQIGDLGRQSLRDTRQLLGVLRAGEPIDEYSPRGPQPDIGDLDELVDRVRATGLDAFLMCSGSPYPVTAGLGLTVYRIVQEALTNTVKHAHSARTVRIELRYEPDQLSIDISDDGHPDAHDAGHPDGHGLPGMRERAAAYQGSLQAGERPGGGWHVHARLPRELAGHV
ncbi:MAG: two-component sensor histidine kinase [Candidatus Nephthysia bennettiae]|nr:MAG: two-component sensor histidine kinase [Candidatus Dormibacteraeota bacterium]